MPKIKIATNITASLQKEKNLHYSIKKDHAAVNNSHKKALADANDYNS